MSILGFLMVLGTMIGVVKTGSKMSMTEKVLTSFSILENGRKVLSTKQGGADHITCLGGIR